MNLDSLDEMLQAQSGRYTDWHTPILSAMWRVLMLIGLRSPGWVLAGSTLTFLAGLYLVLRIRFARPWAVLGAVLVLAFPPVLGYGTEVGSDAWFISFLVCGFGLAARGARTEGWSRTESLVLAALCAFFTQTARQGALPVVAILLFATALVALRPRWREWKRIMGAVGAALAGAAVIAVSVVGFQQLVLHATVLHAEQETYKYDLVMLSLREGVVLLPPDVYRRQDLNYLRQSSSVLSIDPLLWPTDPAIPPVLTGARFNSLQHAWISAILRHPLGYLTVRMQTVPSELAIDSRAIYVYQVPPQPPEARVSPANPALYRTVMRYVGVGAVPNRFGAPMGGPLQAVWLYVPILLLVATTWYLARRRRGDIVAALLGVAMLVYAAIIVMLAPLVLYRYMFPCVVAAALLTVLLAGDGAAEAWRAVRATRD